MQFYFQNLYLIENEAEVAFLACISAHLHTTKECCLPIPTPNANCINSNSLPKTYVAHTAKKLLHSPKSKTVV